MKLKNKVISTVLGIIASSFVFIAVPVSANAGDCSASDPCMTYAEVDSSGNVTNVIVCQPSVCGPNGQFGGILNGNKLVPQVAANPATHDTSGTTGQMTSQEQNQVVTLSTDNVFTVKKDEVVIQTIIKPEIEIVKTGTNTTTTTTSMEAEFGLTYRSTEIINEKDPSILPTVGAGEDPMPPLETNNDYVKIDVTQTINSKTVMPGYTTNSVSTITETVVFEERKTQQEVISYIQNSGFSIMKAKIDRLIKLLGEWTV